MFLTANRVEVERAARDAQAISQVQLQALHRQFRSAGKDQQPYHAARRNRWPPLQEILPIVLGNLRARSIPVCTRILQINIERLHARDMPVTRGPFRHCFKGRSDDPFYLLIFRNPGDCVSMGFLEGDSTGLASVYPRDRRKQLVSPHRMREFPFFRFSSTPPRAFGICPTRPPSLHKRSPDTESHHSLRDFRTASVNTTHPSAERVVLRQHIPSAAGNHCLAPSARSPQDQTKTRAKRIRNDIGDSRHSRGNESLHHLDRDTDDSTQYHGHNCGSVPLPIARKIGTKKEAEGNETRYINQDIPCITERRGKLFPRRCQY